MKLKRFAEHASRYSVNLDGFVDKDNAPHLRGGYAFVWSGVLRLKDALTLGKEIARNRLFGDEDTMKVDLLRSLMVLASDERESRWL